MNNSALFDKNGYIKISALDHRGSLLKILPEEDIDKFKNTCIESFSPYVTGVLLDPEFMKKSGETPAGSHPIKVPLLLTLEKSGNTDTTDGKLNELIKDFDPQIAKEMGASAVKLLIYYNTDAPAKKHQIEIAKICHEKSKRANLPLLLEIVTYPFNNLHYSESHSIIKAVEELKGYGDILKLNYCDEFSCLSELKYLEKPWVLLSRGRKYEDYKKCLINAKEIGGASGFAVGRAVWQEVGDYKTWKEKENFIKTTALKRIKELSEIF